MMFPYTFLVGILPEELLHERDVLVVNNVLLSI